MTKPLISNPIPETKNPEARIIIFTFCVAVPMTPTEEQKEHALAQFVKVAKVGMKLDVITAQVVTMTEEQARKAFEDAELADAAVESQGQTRQ